MDDCAWKMNKQKEEYFPVKEAGVIRRNWRVLLRILFASIWSVDAYFKWLFVYNGQSLAETIGSASQGQPLFARDWITFWARVSISTPGFTLSIAVLETSLALFLFLGLFTPEVSIIGIVYNLFLWSTAEGFGGIFQRAPTDIGTAPLYAVIFAGLIVIQAGREKGLDEILHAKLPSFPFW